MDKQLSPGMTKLSEDKFAELGEFSCDIEYGELLESDMAAFTASASKEIYDALTEKVMKEVPQLLTFANFFGDAETYMASVGVPFTKQVREQYAKTIFDEYMHHLPEMIVLNEKEQTVLINILVNNLELGTMDLPAVEFISKCIKEWAENSLGKESNSSEGSN